VIPSIKKMQNNNDAYGYQPSPQRYSQPPTHIVGVPFSQQQQQQPQYILVDHNQMAQQNFSQPMMSAQAIPVLVVPAEQQHQYQSQLPLPTQPIMVTTSNGTAFGSAVPYPPPPNSPYPPSSPYPPPPPPHSSASAPARSAHTSIEPEPAKPQYTATATGGTIIGQAYTQSSNFASNPNSGPVIVNTGKNEPMVKPYPCQPDITTTMWVVYTSTFGIGSLIFIICVVLLSLHSGNVGIEVGVLLCSVFVFYGLGFSFLAFQCGACCC